MTTIHPDSTEEFEFIQTPAAPEQTKPAFDCGVPTTLVSPRTTQAA
jgi:cyclopropane-fatty-acyl-phospholipid synthase